MSCSLLVLFAPDRVCVHLTGEVDLSVSDLLRGVLFDLLDQTVGAVEVNLRGLQFLDCTGISALLRVQEHANHNGRVLFVSEPGQGVLWALGLSGTLTVLTSGSPSPQSSTATGPHVS